MNRIIVSSWLVPVFCAIALVGCGVPELPDTFDVAISAAEMVNAPRGSGAAAAAHATWTGFRGPDAKSGEKAAPGPYGGLLNGGILERPPVDGQVFIADFGAWGDITAIHENQYFLPQVYGDELEVGGDWAAATVPFMRFKSACYGVQIDDRYGLAVVVHVRLGPLYVGRAIIYSWGTIGEEDGIVGQFGYLLDFTDGLADIVLDSGGDQYPFYAVQTS